MISTVLGLCCLSVTIILMAAAAKAVHNVFKS